MSDAADSATPTLTANPRRPAAIGLGVIAAFISLFVLWSALAPLSGAAIAGGNLKVEGNRQTVQHPYGGVVQKLLVKEGDKVAKDQVVIILSDTEPRAQLAVLDAEESALKATEVRLIAERDNTVPSFDTIVAEHGGSRAAVQAAASETSILKARQRQYESEAGTLQQRIAQLNEQITGSTAQATGLQRQSALIGEEAAGARKLAESGYTPKTRVMALDRTAAQLEADLGVANADIARARQAIGEAEVELAKLERTRVTEIASELRTAQAKLAQLSPKIDAAKDRLARTQVTAPATGAVVGLQIFTEGGVIQPGARLLDIVPTDNPLIAEGRLLLADVNEVTPGRDADVRLTSVPRTERPILRGRILTVSADRLTDERSGQGYYSIQAQLDPADVRNAGMELQSGMPLEIVMPTRARTLVTYLIGPLLDEMSGAFRER
jgi:HlyD family secretion protein/epimerase transport system membrane fusion protein